MAKQTGLGDGLLIGGYNVGGDIQQVTMHGGPALLEVTDITQSAKSRLGGLRDGEMEFTAYFDPAAGASHAAFSALPTSDVQVVYLRGSALGNPACCQQGKQLNYDPTRSNDGSLTEKISVEADPYGQEWGIQLTPGVFSAANLLTGQNSGFEGGIGNWVQAGGCTVADSSAQAHSGSDSLALTCTTAGTMGAASCLAANITTQGFAAPAGQLFTVQMYARAATTGRTCTPQIAFYTSAGSLISTISGTAVADVTTGWTLLTVGTAAAPAAAPATSAYARVLIQVASAGLTEVHYLDDIYVFAAPGSVNNGASYAFGAQAYLQMPSFTGTDVTVVLQHAPDNETWSTLGSFAQVTGATPLAQRLALAGLFTCPTASPGVFTTTSPTAITYAANQPVQLSTLPGQVLPGGFSAGTTYYVISPSAGTFQLAATANGSAINATSPGAGVVGAVVDQYVQAELTTVGGFTAVSLAVAININRTVTGF
jgi:hypothetical protein